MNTTKAVQKLRKEAQEQREKLRKEKEIHNNQRLTQWGTDSTPV